MQTSMKSLKVKIPPGTQHDEVLHLRNEGLPRFKGGGYVAVKLNVQVKISDKLTEKQRELYEKLRSLS